MTRDLTEGHRHRVLPLANFEANEVPAVVDFTAGRRLARELGEVVDNAGLVHDEVRELADASGVVRSNAGTDDVLGLRGVGVPE